jgi:hypothetical protein
MCQEAQPAGGAPPPLRLLVFRRAWDIRPGGRRWQHLGICELQGWGSSQVSALASSQMHPRGYSGPRLSFPS